MTERKPTNKKRGTVDQAWMLQVQEKLGGIGESLKNGDAHRADVIRILGDQSKRIEELSSDLRTVDQNVRSQSNALALLATEKCGERLDKLEQICKNLPKLERDVGLWQVILGGGFHALWKVAVLLLGSGTIGAAAWQFASTHWKWS